MGLLTAFIGMAFGLWIIAKTLLLGENVQGYPSLISVITLLGGVQLISVSVVGAYVGKTYFAAKRRPVYLIRDLLHSCQADAADRKTGLEGKNGSGRVNFGGSGRIKK